MLGLPCIQLFEVVVNTVADKIFDQSYCTINDSRIKQQCQQQHSICAQHFIHFPSFYAQKGRRTAFCRTAALFQLQDHAVLEDGDLAEAVLFRLGLLAAGHTDDQIQHGITVEGAILMPSYIKVDEQKNLFNDAKLGDVITFNPKKAYPENDTEVSSLLKIEREAVKDLESEFSFQITEIQRFKKHEINEELFKQVLGEDTDVKDEAAFRAKIAEAGRKTSELSHSGTRLA